MIGFLEIRVNFIFTGWRGTPLDFQMMWNLNDYSKFCHSLGYSQDVFNFEIKLETIVNECFFGPFGWLLHDLSIFVPDDPLDCFRRRYAP